MKILDVLQKETILDNLKSRDKKGLIEELSKPIALQAGVKHEHLVRMLMERERLGSTGIGDGIGIPHAKIRDLESLYLGFGLSRKGVDFESMDGRPTYIFFLMITPEDSTALHLKVLARIAKILRKETVREKLLGAAGVDDIFDVIGEEDEEF
jgi:PTS system nitrogen regulatory IIA component